MSLLFIYLSAITQITASCCGEKTTSQYVIPDKVVSHSASATTGISFDGVAFNCIKIGEGLDSFHLSEALGKCP